MLGSPGARGGGLGNSPAGPVPEDQGGADVGAVAWVPAADPTAISPGMAVPSSVSTSEDPLTPMPANIWILAA